MQGELDTQVTPSNADRLEALARARKHAAAARRRQGAGRQPPAGARRSTGEVDEYATLPDKQISPAVSTRRRRVAEEDAEVARPLCRPTRSLVAERFDRIEPRRLERRQQTRDQPDHHQDRRADADELRRQHEVDVA